MQTVIGGGVGARWESVWRESKSEPGHMDTVLFLGTVTLKCFIIHLYTSTWSPEALMPLSGDCDT